MKWVSYYLHCLDEEIKAQKLSKVMLVVSGGAGLESQPVCDQSPHSGPL